MKKYSRYSTKNKSKALPGSKRLSAMITVIAMAFMLSSCAGTNADGVPSDEPTASPLPEVYHNGAYGISVTVPDGWIIAGVNETNMTESPGKSADIKALDIIPYEDSGSEIQLIELWSRIDSADKEHASLMVYIEIYDGMDEQVYLQAFEDAYAGYFDGYFSELLLKEEAVIGGKEYSRLQYLTQLPGNEDEYYEEYYIRSLSEGEFLVLCATYWAGNQVSRDDAIASLEYVTVKS